MRKPIGQYLQEHYQNSVSSMAADWGIAESSLRRMITATKPVNVYKHKSGDLTIESELKRLAKVRK